MAIIEIKIPSPGESITHVELSRWLVEEGAFVQKDTEIAELESEKATLMLMAEESGKISLKATEGESIEVGAVACTIDTSVQPEESVAPAADDKTSLEQPPASGQSSEKADTTQTASQDGKKISVPSVEESTATGISTAKTAIEPSESQTDYDKIKITPLAKKVMIENGLSVEDVINGLRRLKREDVETVLGAASDRIGANGLKRPVTRESKSERMSSLRRKLSERLVSVKNETAMLTTFNEVDMKPIMDLRKKYQTQFMEKHGIKLGIMSFFLKACSVALREFPNVNAMLDGENMITYDYADISVAVSTPKGLMVPVIRNVESLGLAEIERALEELAAKARSGKISIPEMSGGTFTVTNGGIFGSMMSTPLINPPQSAILGMHNIQERPVAIDGQVVIRPMMYVALSYDHRVIDGKESVGFLVRVKQLLEKPTDILFGGSSGEKALLGV
ncbi:2-oxoglutarate dehydrogenase complex dihydrolipoyllysine-residue succinyltransferase [Proteiniphilum acetatigenes]|uniref:2-oxoglutarate dehydrogenase complex dihydrolipoyllysine-residue succinyltransferase n=1 Tax=Proteiniphilum acetatigenes TaxID=294710 RepID=UPI0003821405|nr:2-oxoglutarate dehydrogenase complex dihydrolipoyllysine-residue succinyltransferase [Proteiniphilum acetatigenes]SFL16635.1 2-oxoglutarate dehydrogenase E2 component [Porphyromonadaceae bacterium KH3CP3RA]